jgi:cytochrome P450
MTRPPEASFRSAVASLRQPLSFMTSNVIRYPRIFRSGLLGFSAYVVHHPPFIRQVLSTNARNYVKFEKYRYLRFIGGNGLVTNEGEPWRRQRQLIQPAFRHQSMSSSVPLMIEAIDQAIDELRAARTPVVNVSEVMARLTLAIAARSLFSSDVRAQTALIRHELEVAQQRGNILLRIPLPLYRAVPWIPYLNRGVRSGHILRGIVQGLIDERRRMPDQPDDLLGRLMAARDDATVEGMTDEQLRDEILTLLFGGHETTLHALSWAFWLVGQSPETHARLRDEGRAAVSMTNPEVDLPFAGAVAREVMRLYPPVYLIGRTAIDEDQLGEFGVPRGTNVMINIYGLHRHPDFWDEPEAFRPERMLDPQAWDPTRFVYVPFGAGPRGCIGYRFSTYEMQLVLSRFAVAFDWELADGGPLGPSPQFTLKTARPVSVRLS